MKFNELLEKLDYADLARLQKDLHSGGADLKRMVNEKVRHAVENQSRICVTCGTAINPFNINDYSLVFGPHDFKKRASFCALDCLEYFLRGLKKTAPEQTQTI